mgnify:CR=1 FL=1
MKIVLYGNGGSGNHGCEAIVRSTLDLLKDTPFEKKNFDIIETE